MAIKILVFYFTILGTAFALDYSKCTNLINENRVSYETKNCSMTFCLIQFSCDFGMGPIIMNAACKIAEKSNQCPSIQECISDSTVEFKELDIERPLNNSSPPSSSNRQRVMEL